MNKTLTIDPALLYRIITDQMCKDEKLLYEIVYTEITGSDPEDGGGDYTYVVYDKQNDVYYIGSYCDWDIDNTSYDHKSRTIGPGCRCDLINVLTQVFPKEVTQTIYVDKL